MSATQSGREVAQRTFATELEDATHQFQADDAGERAPKYQLLPTGQRANRVFVVGTLTETENVGSESDYWQARVVDPTGTVFVYAGQYQPDAMAFLEQADTPQYVAVVGKPQTYESGDENGTTQTYVSVQPESIRTVSETERDQWVHETTEQTLDRVQAFIARDGESDDDGAPDSALARAQYGSNVSKYHEGAIDALEDLSSSDD
jgi:RPA family protein